MAEVQVAPATSVSSRALGALAYVIALTTWITVAGLPKQSLLAVAWIWLATIAWNVRAPLRRHLDFARDWGPAVAVLIVYLYSRGLADELGIVAVHERGAARTDAWLFGGTLPTEYLQGKLCGVPCERTMSPHWYDVVLTTVYYSHFFVALSIAGVLWVRNRTAWRGYLRRYLSLNMLGLFVYITFPMAPPWMAAQDGVVSSDVARITGRGWYDLDAGGTFHERFSAVGNPVAAMPSLHAGIAIFVAAYGIGHLRSRSRWLLVLYPAAMSFMLVYYAEHYVIDVVAGAVAVAVVMTGWARWEGRSRAREPDLGAADPIPVGALRSGDP
jgi:hypothetical protein